MELENILEKFDKQVEEATKEILQVVKKGTKSYSDVKKNLRLFKQQSFFKIEGIEKYKYLFTKIEDELEKEMNDLPLTNRSK